MVLKNFRLNITFFIISYALLCSIIFFVSFRFFLNDFLILENRQNQTNIHTFLNSINKNIESLKNTTNDYSKWDDSYEFMTNNNQKYIYENFREGSQTLSELNLSAIIYLTLKNTIQFSEYNNDYLKSNQKDFENYLIDKFKNEKNVNTIINYNSNLIYLSKSEIKKSDHMGECNGFVLTLKLVNDKILSNNFSIFKTISISNNYLESTDEKLDFEYLNTKTKVDLQPNYLINTIQFFNKNNEFIISLITTNERDIINNSKRTIYIFNLIVFLIIGIIFLFIYKNQYLIDNQNRILNEEVEKRTRQLYLAYEKLDEKNKELYEYANMDALTKIRNRRNYFIESKKLLENSILENRYFHILMIDIDNFKKINDRFGHANGDKVLINFCKLVNSIIDKDAIFGRIGGEEFCITFYNKDVNEITKISETIRKECEKSEIIENGNKITFTISMGLSSRNDLKDIDKILQKADELLYLAKGSGKNRLIRESTKI